MAALPAGQSGLPLARPAGGPAPERPGLNWEPSQRVQLALAAVILIGLAALCWHFNAKPRHEAFAAVPDAVRAVVAMVLTFAVAGFGPVRLLLPQALRRFELLWVLPTGACAVGLELTVLGFAGVPYAVSLTLTLLAGLLMGALGVRRHGWPELPPRRLAWPAFLAFVVLVVALVPMVFHQHFDTPTGTGSDATNAVGAAQFLKHSYPTSVNITQPLNQMPSTWQSKFPIYYAFAAISSVSGMPTWQILAPLEAVLLALAATGMFLMAFEVFGAPIAVSLAAMGVAGLDRMALYTALNPYLNQTWGFFALPFTVVLGWIVAQPGLPRRARQSTGVLLAVFALVLVLAYPLAAPIPAVPLVVFWWGERRRRIRSGERIHTVRELYKGRRSLLWMVPVAAALAIPVAGAVTKAVGAAEVLAPGHSLQSWGGDLGHFVPFNFFFSLPNSALGWVLFAGVVGLVVLGLARQPRSLALGLGGLLLVGIGLAAYLRHRQFGYYFEFKLLAFIGPVMLLIAAVGAARLRRAAAVALVALAATVSWSVYDDLRTTGYQLPLATVHLSSWASSLPAGASVRLDMWPPDQLWVSYFMDSRRLCSRLPLLGTDYPHVAYSIKADYILTTADLPRPAQAVGPLLRANDGYRLYRMSPAVPGPDRCTLRRFDRIYSGAGHMPF